MEILVNGASIDEPPEPAEAEIDIPKGTKTGAFSIGDEVKIVLTGKLKYLGLGELYSYNDADKQERIGKLKLEVFSLEMKKDQSGTMSDLADDSDD